jgi:hypothetical protein
MRLKPTPYDANTIACTASEVVYGSSPNQIGGRTARIAAVTAIGRSAQVILRDAIPTRPPSLPVASTVTARAGRGGE